MQHQTATVQNETETETITFGIEQFNIIVPIARKTAGTNFSYPDDMSRETELDSDVSALHFRNHNTGARDENKCSKFNQE